MVPVMFFIKEHVQHRMTVIEIQSIVMNKRKTTETIPATAKDGKAFALTEAKKLIVLQSGQLGRST